MANMDITPQAVANSTNNVIVASSLTKRYGDHTVVDNLSLRIGRGEIYGFLGLNGAGKTTTIRMLLSMIRPTGGSARLFGVPVRANASAIWARVGYLVETPYAYPELTVHENLEVSRRLHQVSDPHTVDRIMKRLSLVQFANRRAATLSLGNAQRLGLAKALLHDPELLILDEPANGLDPAGVVEVRELLRELAHARGVTVFVSSHMLSEVARLVTRIGIIHQGRLIEELDADQLERNRRQWLVVDARDRGAARSTLASAGFAVDTSRDGTLTLNDTRATAHPEDIAQRLVQAGVALTRLAVEEEDLETHFLRLVGMEQGEPGEKGREQ
jgi:ABC-2 type transport system ATP-binding protein